MNRISNSVANAQRLYVELIVLFVLIPLSLALNMPKLVKFGLVLCGLVYVVIASYKGGLFKKDILIGKTALIDEKAFWYKVAFYLPVSTLVGWFVYRENLFNMVRDKPMLWLGFSVLYSIFSVYVQEFLYRTFFFFRYGALMSGTNLLWVNAIIFGLAHSMFKNFYIVCITAVGGLMLAMTYQRTKSLFIIWIEHSIYGCWLFTLGVGKELAFPENSASLSDEKSLYIEQGSLLYPISSLYKGR